MGASYVYSPQQVRGQVDWWTDYTSVTLPPHCDLEHAGCFGMRLFVAPRYADQLMLPGTYLKYSLQLQPGSFITGLTQPVSMGGTKASCIFVDETDTGFFMQAVLAGEGGNHITITIPKPAGPNQSFSIAVVAMAITVTVATDGSSHCTTTWIGLINALNAYAPAAALATWTPIANGEPITSPVDQAGGTQTLGGVGGSAVVPYTWRVTDISLNHVWNDNPMPQGPILFPRPGQPFLLSAPYPVTGSGIFQVEFWNPTGGAVQNVRLTFRVAERLDLPPAKG